jgi:hypothetical protein
MSNDVELNEENLARFEALMIDGDRHLASNLSWVLRFSEEMLKNWKTMNGELANAETKLKYRDQMRHLPENATKHFDDMVKRLKEARDALREIGWSHEEAAILRVRAQQAYGKTAEKP